MRDVAIISFAQLPSVRRANASSVELLLPVIQQAVASSGLDRREIGFWVHGSADYMTGQPFSFVAAVDAIGAWPPVAESHVEMDGAWALYEAWVKIQTGETDTAMVFANGKSSAGELRRIMALQLDPYYQAPMMPDSISIAALQARVMLDRGLVTEAEMAEVASRSQRDALANPNAQIRGDHSVASLLEQPYMSDPLRLHDCPPVSDSCAAVVIAAGDVARAHCSRPAWIRSVHHVVDVQNLGWRDLAKCGSAASAATRAGIHADKIDVAELHAPFSHQELLLRSVMGIDPAATTINPSGGALVANPMMAAGLIRMGEVARRIWDGSADRGVAHATSGPALQQNLVCVLEGE